MTARDERAAALIRRHRDLADDFARTLPLLLDDLDAIDARHAPAPGGDQVAAWIESHPREFEAWVRRQQRIQGGPLTALHGPRTAAGAPEGTGAGDEPQSAAEAPQGPARAARRRAR